VALLLSDFSSGSGAAAHGLLLSLGGCCFTAQWWLPYMKHDYDL
jgi:hypothetical protein